MLVVIATQRREVVPEVDAMVDAPAFDERWPVIAQRLPAWRRPRLVEALPVEPEPITTPPATLEPPPKTVKTITFRPPEPDDRVVKTKSDEVPEVRQESKRLSPKRLKSSQTTGNICTRHKMRKVVTNGGRSWRCKR